MGTNNPVAITFYTWASMIRDVRRARSLYEVCGYIFGPPDWIPAINPDSDAPLQNLTSLSIDQGSEFR